LSSFESLLELIPGNVNPRLEFDNDPREIAMKMRLLSAVVSASVVTLAACQTAPPKRQALDTAAIAAVQGEIKRQVGVYLREAARRSPGKPEDFWCGTGNIDFDISQVKAELTTTLETITNKSVGLKIPWGAVEIDPTGSVKGDATNTQVLDYNLWPFEAERQMALMQATVNAQKPAPIADVILALRDALIASAKKTAPGPQPCFTDYDPAKPGADAGNTFKLGLSFVNDTTTGLEIKVWVLDLNATNEWKSTTGNTLTVSFVQRGLAQLQRARDMADAECKYPKKYDDHPCQDALAAYTKLQEKSGGYGIR
jgi:hypothetical protein